MNRATSPRGAKTRIFSIFVQPLIYIFHPSSQGPGPGPGTGPGPGPAEQDGQCVFFFKRVCKPLLLHEFVRNSSFTRQVGLIIAEERVFRISGIGKFEFPVTFGFLRSVASGE